MGSFFSQIGAWIGRVFGPALVEALVYTFRCLVCQVTAVLSEAAARKAGWKPVAGKGWTCAVCSAAPKQGGGDP